MTIFYEKLCGKFRLDPDLFAPAQLFGDNIQKNTKKKSVLLTICMCVDIMALSLLKLQF